VIGSCTVSAAPSTSNRPNVSVIAPRTSSREGATAPRRDSRHQPNGRERRGRRGGRPALRGTPDARLPATRHRGAVDREGIIRGHQRSVAGYDGDLAGVSDDIHDGSCPDRCRCLLVGSAAASQTVAGLSCAPVTPP
jgi:hypothetical protein